MYQPRVPRGVPSSGEYASTTHATSGVNLSGDPSWPAIAYEERPWGEAPDPRASRRQRLSARGPYQAAVVPTIADLNVAVDSHTQALVETATMDMVRFDSEMGHEQVPFAALLLRSESASSSQIENLTAGARKIALAQLGDTTSPNATLIASNVRALQAAINLSDDLSTSNIASMHRALLSSSAHDIAGRYREEQVWIRGNSPHSAEFVPPHHERVPEALGDLIEFMDRDDIPALTQAAIAHAQFETIHPFADGNGRTGRAIVSALLRAKDVTTYATVPVSSGLLVDTKSYFNALSAYRDGDIQPIVERFAEAALLAVDNGRALAEEIRDIRARHQVLTASLSPALKRIISLLPAEPAMTAEMVTTHAEVSFATAYRAVQRLVELGVLAPAVKVKGTSVWVSPSIIKALDDFAKRAGRRTRG